MKGSNLRLKRLLEDLRSSAAKVPVALLINILQWVKYEKKISWINVREHRSFAIPWLIKSGITHDSNALKLNTKKISLNDIKSTMIRSRFC